METKHTYKQIIIIPDVHGRDFWEPIVAKYKNDTDVLIIFLGDYLDPYTSIDGISEADAIFNFTKIINEASSANNIITLFGNHDLHYFPQLLYSGYASRRIEWAKYEMSEIFSNNRDMFKVAYETRINGRKYLFTHAGVLPGWLNWLTTLDEENDETWCEEHKEDIEFYRTITADADSLNRLTSCKAGIDALNIVSYERNGSAPFGSCMWADVREHLFTDRVIDEAGNQVYQVFGHTFGLPSLDEPYITEDFAMLDCRKAFTLDCTTGQITPYAE